VFVCAHLDVVAAFLSRIISLFASFAVQAVSLYYCSSFLLPRAGSSRRTNEGKAFAFAFSRSPDFLTVLLCVVQLDA
jgi:hypothetical protein